jgi:hypothetical protein
LKVKQATCFHAGILRGLIGPEDGSDMFIRNVGCLSTDYTALYPTRQQLFITTGVRTSNPTNLSLFAVLTDNTEASDLLNGTSFGKYNYIRFPQRLIRGTQSVYVDTQIIIHKLKNGVNPLTINLHRRQNIFSVACHVEYLS